MTGSASDRTNLVGLPPRTIESLLEAHVDRAFRGAQVAHWVVHRNAGSFSEMTNLPKSLREELDRHFELSEPEVVAITSSSDVATSKYLFRLRDAATVEGVAMAEGRKLTLCLSTQTGCALGCAFCVTGALGSGRNLTADEMVGQYRRMLRHPAAEPERVNIVFMGMGEPLLNTDNLEQALEVLFERVSPKRITVSTAGIVPGIRRLAEMARRPKLAVSLNAPDQPRREAIMPVARRYPLPELLGELRRFPLEGGRRITFEYVLIRDFNDSPADARLTAGLLSGIPSKVNVIPFNEDPERLPRWQRPDAAGVDRFAEVLRDQGLTVTVRWSRGLDVGAACGQLKGMQPEPTPQS